MMDLIQIDKDFQKLSAKLIIKTKWANYTNEKFINELIFGGKHFFYYFL